MRIATRCVLLLTFLVGSALAQTPTGTDTGSYDRSELFPRPPQLRDAIEFWTRVYTEVDSNGGFIHDSRYLGVVYETIRLDEGTSSRQRRRVTQRAQREYRDILNKLAADDGGSLTTDEARVRALWPADATAEDFRQAAQRLRFQLGQADRYKAGLMRSGRWKPHILAVLEARGLPSELAVLPHVESSFDPTAYSKVGAAGMWQFTRSTGLRYMQIDHIIDERRDPYLSTDAAARLLEDNYAVIQSWPLALTAYNHGLAGMRRAVGRLGTDDIGVIVDDYRSRTFGFASRNFYAAFIAALEVDQNADRYFRDIAIDRPEDLVVIEMPAYIDATPLAAALNISMRELRRLNPALMDSVWAGDKYVPAGFPLRLPRTVVADASELEALVPASERFAEQRPDLYHRVRPGDTLSGIADQYRVSLAALVRANGLSNRNFIRVGQQITLPIAGGQAAPPLPSASPATPPADGQYVVRRGDSIDLIARRFGVDQGELLSLNSIANRNRIYPGQVLELPGMAGESAAPTESPATSVSNVAVAAAEVVDTIIETVVETVVAEEAPEVVASAIDTEAPALAETVTEALSNELAFSDDAEPDLDSNVLASTQSSLAADPSDYSVADDLTIEVQDMETLGHYADWLGIRTQRLRDINGMPFREPVVYGQRIKLDFSTVDAATFEARRQAYQIERQESFFQSYHITETVNHVVRRGDSLWQLAQRRYNVPVWLLRQYNPDIDLDRVRPGVVIKFPLLAPIGEQRNANLAAVSRAQELG